MTAVEYRGDRPDDDWSSQSSSGRKRRRLAFWLGGAAAFVAVLVAAILLLVNGFNAPPPPAPMPAATFDLAPSQVPNPVSGPMPALAQPHDGTGTSWTATQAHPRPDTAAPTSADGASALSTTGASQVPPGPIADNHLVIPVLGVNAEVEENPLVKDSLTLPSDVSKVTEWTGSAPIAATTGSVLVAGHVDNKNQGLGALFYIHTLQPGDAVYLTLNGTVTRWKVTGMQAFTKADLPSWVFAGNSGSRKLNLVTCGGKLVHDAQGRGSYLDNVVVTAVPF